MNAPVASVTGAFFVSSAHAAEAGYPFLAVITRGPVNVRAGANTNFESIDKLNQGAQVVVLAKSYEWCKIQLPVTAAAFVRADYVQAMDRKTASISGSRVNIRAKPNSESSTIGQLAKGEMIKLQDKVNEWWKIEPPASAVGWVHQDFLKMTSPHVPDEMLRKRALANVGVVTPQPVAPVQPVPVHVRGKMELLPQSLPGARYKISLNGKTIYYLQDAAHFDRFTGAVVTVEGKVKDSAFDYPLLQVNKITLLL